MVGYSEDFWSKNPKTVKLSTWYSKNAPGGGVKQNFCQVYPQKKLGNVKKFQVGVA